MTTITMIDLHDLVAYEPEDDRADVEKLVRSIQLDGLIEPLRVVQDGQRGDSRIYRVVHGLRRLKAVRHLWLEDETVYDRKHRRISLGRTLYRTIPCEILSEGEQQWA